MVTVQSRFGIAPFFAHVEKRKRSTWWISFETSLDSTGGVEENFCGKIKNVHKVVHRAVENFSILGNRCNHIACCETGRKSYGFFVPCGKNLKSIAVTRKVFHRVHVRVWEKQQM